jgi:hypothetical protein
LYLVLQRGYGSQTRISKLAIRQSKPINKNKSGCLTAAATSRRRCQQRVDKQGIKLFANEQASIRISLALLSFHRLGFAAALMLLLLVVAGGGVGHGRFVSSDDDVKSFGVTYFFMSPVL